MNILSKLFRSREVKDVLFALDSLDATSLGETLCYDEIKSSARKAISDGAASIRRLVIVDGKKPLEIALNLVINLCGRDLGSGQDHTYRGVLGMRGTAKRALFSEAQSMMVERGYISLEDADYGRELLTTQIKEVG